MYSLNYFEHVLRNCSATSKDITSRRWNFIKEIKAKRILDYGSGVGWFRAWKPSDIIVDSYDIGPFPQTGINEWDYDLICFWDSLEHISDFTSIFWLLEHTKYVVISIPIKPDNVKMDTWKHNRPYEHLHQFTLEGLDKLFTEHNFVNIKQNQNECPPREDIWTVLYQKKEEI